MMCFWGQTKLRRANKQKLPRRLINDALRTKGCYVLERKQFLERIGERSSTRERGK